MRGEAMSKKTKTEAWLHFDSVLYLHDWSEDRIAREVVERNIKNLTYALNHGRRSTSFSCSVQSCQTPKHILKKGVWAVYGHHVVYDSLKPTVAIGIRCLLSGLCHSCIEHALRAEKRSLGASE